MLSLNVTVTSGKIKFLQSTNLHSSHSISIQPTSRIDYTASLKFWKNGANEVVYFTFSYIYNVMKRKLSENTKIDLELLEISIFRCLKWFLYFKMSVWSLSPRPTPASLKTTASILNKFATNLYFQTTYNYSSEMILKQFKNQPFLWPKTSKNLFSIGLKDFDNILIKY